ncbi:DUF6712 family protein [Runella limosa]|uniref:DUF6712 family protein n=1 Tax=Runella limosa TaxID=370978 RepID=UPI00040BB09E|nr:DUF6712 family protein [Runella limosa]
MSIFSNNNDFRGCIPANVSFSIENIEPFLVEVETTTLSQHISRELYSQVLESVSQGGELLTLCRRVVAPLALVKYLPFGEVQISDVGITTVGKSADRTAAYAYQVANIEQAALTMGFNALEVLIDFLESNSEDYPTYAESPEHTENTRLIVPNAKQFSSIYQIFNSQLTYYALRPILSNFQEDTLRKTVGDELFSEIISSNDPDKKDLLWAAKKWLVYRTLIEAFQLQLAVEINAGGLRVNYGSMFSNTYKYYTPPTDQQVAKALGVLKEKERLFWGVLSGLINRINGVEVPVVSSKMIAIKGTVLF